MAAYVIFIRSRTRDRAEPEKCAEQSAAFMAGHTVNVLACFTGKFEVAEGPEAEGVAILEFPTLDEGKAWYLSPAYQEASQHRYRGGDYTTIIVDGARE